MRALLVTLFGMAGATSLMLSMASADMVMRAPFAEKELRSRVAKLRTSDAINDPDTVWVGHVNTVTGAPGTPGGYGPHHIGRGPNNIVGGLLGSAASYNGVWSFDHFNIGETDSLMGWWPIQAPFGSVGPTDLDDNLRPWFSLDYGNQGNYTIQQGAANKRTFGVTGYWHADGGNTQAAVPGNGSHNPVTPSWAPIAGTKSAWCGLRSHGDVAVMDPITGNGYNSTVLSFWGNNSGNQIGSVSASGTDQNFPGYGSQWDQILYRDVTLPANLGGGQDLTISFSYATNMSNLGNEDHSSQAGWFDKDPLKTAVAGDGNYYSANSAVPALVDSFMVYIGAPVNDAAVTFSDGTVGAVYDPQRRWFSEVVRINSPGTSYRQILSKSGVNATTAFGPVNFAPAVVNPILDLDGGAGNGGRVRLVFRVKTNRGFDDENFGNSGFSSGTAGAALIDNVVVTGPSGSLLNNGFEAAGDIDNSNGVAATAAWKSTGKPPGAWFHVHDIDDGLPYDDPCGAISASVRFCNMGNGVLSPGDHDNADKTGGLYGGNVQDQQKYVVSPTINLKSTGSGDYNGMGIDAEIASRVQMLYGDQLLNVYNYPLTGNGFRYGWQSYPSIQSNGVKTWGEMKKTIFFNFVENRGCFEGIIGLPGDDQLIVTSNPSGVPDSIRAYIESMARCYATPLSALACSPATGVNAGGYYDNLSIGFVTAPPPPQLAVNIWDLFNDAFPQNGIDGNAQPVNAFGVAYDTLAARIQTGYNTAQQTKGDLTGAGARENVAGDTAFVGANGNNVRVDLVFRILPGVGNYVSIGNRASGVARRPDTVPRVAASPADPGNGGLTAVDKFWGAYMADNGAYGTGGNGASGPGHPGGWDPNKWNSARMDTVEVNMFPLDAYFSNEAVAKLTPSFYMTSYHEADPKYAVLGIAKNRCFLNKNTQDAKLDQTDINCGNMGGGAAWPPTFYSDVDVLDGFNPFEIVGSPGKTYEYTKILPDGQLTPGAHVQYFFRKSTVGNPVAFDIVPDTNFVFPQPGEGGYFDLHRWREFSILPDRWKDPGFGAGGNGMACMLVLDLGDRRGDEAIWVAVADTIGLTTAAKRGAHNGWRASSDQNVLGVNIGGDDTIARRDNGGQAGSVWDLFETVAGESNVPSGRPGSRGAARKPGGSLTVGKWSSHGPTGDMANNYKVVVLLASDLGRESIGPVPNQTDDDLGFYENFLNLSGGSGLPRGLIMQGFRIGEALSYSADHAAFMSSAMRATLRNEDYRALSGNTADVSDLIVNPPVNASGAILGVYNPCFIGNDVFNTVATAPSGQAAANYQAVGAGAPYVASVYTPDAGSHPSRTLLNGWTMGLFGGMGGRYTLANGGTRKYFYDVLVNAFGTLACGPSGTPVGVGDEGGPGSSFVNFMNLKSSNPMRSGEARISFGVVKTEKVQVSVFDVTGRLVKKVADRTFQGGTENVVIWDGTNEMGERVKSGVYFYQLKTPTWTSQKKLAVLAN